MGPGNGGDRAHEGRRAPRLIWPTLLLALLVLALCSGLALAAADGPQGPGGSAGRRGRRPSAGPAPTPKGVEIKSARNATSDTYLLPDGAREARVYEAPVNYKDAEGRWMPIEEELEPAPDDAGLTNGANSFDLSLPHRLGSGAVQLSTGDGWVSERLLGEGSEAAEADGNTATYEGASPGTTFELASIPTGVEETIELADASQPDTFRYELGASQGITPSLEEDGSMVFRRGDGTVVARMPAPTVTDGSLGALPDPKAAHYALTSLPDGHPGLELVVDENWLEAPGRVWPVVVDPSLEVRKASNRVCTYFLKEPSGVTDESGECGQYWATIGYVKKEGVTTRTRAAMQFDTSAIPTDASIASASVSLLDELAATEPITVQVRQASKAWDEYLNWFKYVSGPYPPLWWETPGGDFTARGSEVNGGAVPAGEEIVHSEWWNFNGLAKVVGEWVARPSTNDGLIVKIGDETPCPVSCQRSFMFSSTFLSEPARPYLSIRYYPEAPRGSRLSSPTEGTRTARRLKLKSTWTVAGVEGITYQYREGKSGPFETIPSELVHSAEGGSVSWPLPTTKAEREAHHSGSVYVDAAHLTPTLRKKGGVVQVRPLFEGPVGVAGYGPPVETVVDRRMGGPKDANALVGPGSVDLLTGNFSTAHADVSIPTFNSSLEFTRSYSSRGIEHEVVEGKEGQPTLAERKSALGPGWRPGVPVEEKGSSAWRNLKFVHESGTYEEEVGTEEWQQFEWSFSYALLTTINGEKMGFEEKEDHTFAVPSEAPGWKLVKSPEGQYILTSPLGNQTTFSNLGGGEEYVPVAVNEAAGSGVTSTRIEWSLPEAGVKRLKMIVAPTPQGAGCTSEAEAKGDAGCRALIFNYAPATKWGAPAADGERLSSIAYYAPGNTIAGTTGPWTVAEYAYDTEGRLTEEWDPRISPALKEKYTYEPSGALKTITPPGQEPWALEYGTVDEEEGVGRLVAVKRPSLLASPTTAQTSIAYEVPLSGTGAPEQMGPTSVGQWGQTDIPVDATAIFPPDQVPSNPPTSWSHATVHYMDAEGHEVNTLTPAGAGTATPSVATAEIDEFGNVVRELTPDDRVRVLAEPECKHYSEETRMPAAPTGRSAQHGAALRA